MKFIKNLSPAPSLSISEIIFFISSFFGSKPSALIATFNSLTSIVPEPSASNKSNASRISCFCSSFNSGREPDACFFCAPLIGLRAFALAVATDFKLREEKKRQM